MKTVRDQLADFLKANAGKKFASGDLQRMEWLNKDNTKCTPRSVVRRLEELCEEKFINVEYGEKNHAYYCWGNPMKTVKEVVQMFTPDGRPYVKLVEKLIPV